MGLAGLGFFSFLVVVGASEVGSAGAEVLVLAWRFCSMLWFRAAAVSALVVSVGLDRPTTRGLSWPPEGVVVDEGAMVWKV